jgi:hypothetical protein
MLKVRSLQISYYINNLQLLIKDHSPILYSTIVTVNLVAILI